MATASSIPEKIHCLPCEQDETTVYAIYWCRECKGGVCVDCVKSHKKFRMNHSMIPINEVTEADIKLSELNLCENCQKHTKEPLTMYCVNDEEPCCTICALSTHKTCQEVVPLDELAECYTPQIKQNDTKCLQIIKNCLENVTRVETAARRDTEDVTDEMVSKMTSMVMTTKQHLDDLLDSFKSTAQKTKSEGLQKSNSRLERVKEFEQKLTNHLAILALFPHLEPRQCMIASFNMKTEMSDQVKLLEQNRQSSNLVKLNLTTNATIQQLQNIQSLGVISEEESPSTTVSDITEIRNQSRFLQDGLIHVPSPQVAIVSKMKLFTAGVKLLKQITIGHLGIKQPRLFGTTFLQDGRLLASDNYSARLLMFDSNSSFRFTGEYKVAGEPHGVCTSPDQNTVHVVCDNNNVMSYTLQGQWKQTSTFPVESKVYGIGQSGDTFITGHRDQVVLYSKDGQKLSSISIGEGTYSDSLICTSTTGMTFYHKDGDNIVGRKTQDQNKEFNYSHQTLKFPIAASCDRDGNILVVGVNSKNIHQITPDGQNGRVLLDKFSSINKPLSVCCHPQRDLFVVTSRSEDTVMEIYEFC